MTLQLQLVRLASAPSSSPQALQLAALALAAGCDLAPEPLIVQEDQLDEQLCACFHLSGGSAINAAPASSKGKGPPALARSSLFFHASALASFLYGKQTALAEPGDALDRATVLERELLAFASTDLEAALRSWLPRANKRAKTFKSGVSRKDKVALPAIHFVERTLGGDPEADVNPDEQVSAPLSLHADSDRLWASDVVIGAGLAAFVHGRGRKYPHNQHLIAWYETSIASTDWFAQAAALCAIDLSKPKTITAFKTEPSTPLLASAQENKKGKKGKKQKGKGKQASGGKKKGKGKGKGKDKEATGEFGLPLPRPKREWKAPMPARLPEKDKRNVLITSALPYVNNVPHLGNIIGCVLSADVYARYCRLRDYNVIYICGTDEYGTATETKAVQENLTPQQICDKYHAIHAEIYRWFDISFDHFGRTTTPQQTQIAQDIFLKNDANGNVVEKEMSQLWCDTCSKFLADRFVEGTCSNADCRYEDARGDQCDKCSRLLNATELLDPRCKFCRNTPVVKQSTHLFLNLPHLEIDLIDHLLDVDANAPARMATFCEEHHGFVPPPRDEADDDEAYNAQLTAALREHVRKINKARDAPVQPVPEGNIWTSNSTSTTMDWLNRGLQPRPITRDLRWGTPVPREGYENKVFYVWFDAPIGYISITANYTEQWEQWWKAGNKGDRVDPSSDEPEVELVQFMGKDNIPFHTVIFPMSLIGARDNYTVLSSISTTEYLNYEDTKFSKSRGTGVFGNDAKATGIPSEVWRYYLLAVRPEGGDTSFSWQDFARRNNSDLLNNFGNFVNRAVAFTVARFDGKVPARSADAMTDGDRETIAAVEEETRKYIELLEALKIRDGLRSLMAVSSIGNAYLQENKPWDLLKQGPEAVQRCQNVLNIALHIVHHCAILAQPYMPTVSDRIVAQLNLPGAGDLGSDVLRLGDDGHLNLKALAAGHKLGEPELLFASIPDEAVTAFRERFAGKQDVSPDAAAGDVECTARFVAAQVKSVEAHPSSDTLYVLKLDAGEFGDDRQVVSGLVQHYKPEELQGQRVVLFENIKPSKFRKVMSHGMILCADDNGRLGLLRVDDSVAPGTVLAPSGAKLAPVAKFNTKKHMADLGLAVNAQGTVDCQGLPLEPAPVPDTRRGDFASGTKVR